MSKLNLGSTGAGYETKYWCWVRDKVLVAGDLKELEGVVQVLVASVVL